MNDNEILDPATASNDEMLQLMEMYGVIVAALVARQGQVKITQGEIASLMVKDDKPVISVEEGSLVVTMVPRWEFNEMKARNA